MYKREGVEICVAGEWICTAQMPEPETCDAVDNDCDGQTDELDEITCPGDDPCVNGWCAEPCNWCWETGCVPGFECIEHEGEWVCVPGP